MAEGQPHTNRLIHEKSPYLLQHAHNPVDWYPWGQEAFNAAMEADKPIFLSIGYSTCHWCHVMERESFENEAVAELMNETFINVKVDREELPEVDSLYMEFAQSMMPGSAGWPLSVILTPELKPFFASTYLPPYPSQGLMGLTDLIAKVKQIWNSEERMQVASQAEQIVEMFSHLMVVKGALMPTKDDIEDAAEILFKMADSTYGGMRGVPKFPIPYQWSFMLRYATSRQESRALFLVERTLQMMQKGGIHDHLGGGFSRYSVDELWLIPHFEKMLYDNAMLAHTYLEMWQAKQKDIYAKTCKKILQYLMRDMSTPEGGFCSAEDADSEGKEGWYYTWPFEELEKVLAPEEFSQFAPFYGVTKEGNFEGRNLLHTPMDLKEFAEHQGKKADEEEALLSKARSKLLKLRKQRVRPHKDDKVLTSWNGLLIGSLVDAGTAFDIPAMVDAARGCAEFIENHLVEEGQLLRRWRDGEAAFLADLEDYAYLIKGLLSLFDAGQGTKWLNWALDLAEILKERFKSEEGAFYQTDGQDPNLVLRRCPFADGAEPSGNGVHCENLLRLHQITLDPSYKSQAEDILKAVKPSIEQYAPGFTYHLLALDRYYNEQAPTIVVSLNESREHEEIIRKHLYTHFIPHKTVIWNAPDDGELHALLPYLEQQPPIDGKTTLYVCHFGVCKKPMNDIREILKTKIS